MSAKRLRLSWIEPRNCRQASAHKKPQNQIKKKKRGLHPKETLAWHVTHPWPQQLLQELSVVASLLHFLLTLLRRSVSKKPSKGSEGRRLTAILCNLCFGEKKSHTIQLPFFVLKGILGTCTCSTLRCDITAIRMIVCNYATVRHMMRKYSKLLSWMNHWVEGHSAASDRAIDR